MSDDVNCKLPSEQPKPSTIEHENNRSTLQFQQERQNRILSELSGTVQTLSKISHVLDEILDLTSIDPQIEFSAGKESDNQHEIDDLSVAMKQQRLCQELRKWSEVGTHDGRSDL